MLDQFAQLCKEEFRFLIKEFGCQAPSITRHARFREVVYRNQTTGIEVCCELEYTPVVWVSLTRLIDGEDPGAVDRANRHALWAAVQLRSRSGSAEELPEIVPAEAELDRVVSAQARSLCTYAADILLGDFTLFPELGKLEEQRLEERRRQQIRGARKP